MGIASEPHASSVGKAEVTGGRRSGGATSGFLVSSIISSLHTSGLVILSSEPGMGRKRLVGSVTEVQIGNDMHVVSASYNAVDSETACNRLVTACRDAGGRSRRGSRELICITSLPVLDEHDVMRASKAFRRALTHGVSILAVVDLENEMLVEALPEAACYRSYLLLDPDMQQGPVATATGGIPMLVRAYELGKSTGAVDPVRSIAFLDGLSALVAMSLRDTLSSEELSMRAAMMLLGSGTYSDLYDVLGDVDRGILSTLARDAPLFGVDPSGERFACVGLDQTSALLACLPRMLDDYIVAIAPTCAEILMVRGSWKRAAAVAQTYLTGQELARFAGRWGIEALQVGATGLVGRALEVPDAEERPLRAAGLVLSATCDVRPSFASLPLIELTELGVGRAVCAQRARLICLCRKVLRDCSLAQGIGLSPERPDQMSLELLVHLTAVGFMAEGEMTNAFHLLLVHGDRHGDTMSSELLRADFRLARALVGDVVGKARSDGYEASGSFFRQSSMRSFHYVELAIDACRASLDESLKPVDCETLANWADRQGDTLTQAVAMCVAALEDLRGRNCTRAKVRAELASRLGMRVGAPVLQEFALILACVAAAIGEDDVSASLEALEKLPRVVLPSTRRLVAEAISRRQDPAGTNREPLLMQAHGPGDERWALVALSLGIEGLSDLLRGAMPVAWRRVIARDQSGEVASPGADVSAGRVEGEFRVREYEPPIRVNVLGGVSVSVCGIPADDRKLRTRRAKSLIAYLASTRGHSARRHEVMDVVWPECDYESGVTHIYQSTCVVRSVVKRIERDLDPFVLNKKDGIVGLDDTLVSCDADEYREIAIRAIELEGDDEEVLRLAARASDLYAGDLYVPSTDTTGFMELRRRELHDMHADVMVGASEAAMRLGRSRMAARYADSALMMDGLREDGMIALLRAYDACGRKPEAHDRYVAFVRRLAALECRPPSTVLRRVAETMWGPDAGSIRKQSAS